jgi:soluble lytic murein transglycosylase-like protein
MTCRQVLKTLLMAGLSALSLAAVSTARAESGDGGIYGAGAIERNPSAVETAATGPSTEDMTAKPERTTRFGMAVEHNRADAKRSNEVKPLIERYASENELPIELADAVIRLESRYNARARNGANVGLTQINAGTARAMGYKGEVAGLLDAETNLRYGLRYLAQAYKLAGGDTCGTILRFQAGHRAQAMTRAAKIYCTKVQSLLAQAT